MLACALPLAAIVALTANARCMLRQCLCGRFIYRLKNLWQRTDMAHLDVCQNPWGTGLGLVDRCGIGGSGDYATPQTLDYYKQNVSKTLSPPVQ